MAGSARSASRRRSPAPPAALPGATAPGSARNEGRAGRGAGCEPRVAKRLNQADYARRFATDVETKIAGLEKSAERPGGSEKEEKAEKPDRHYTDRFCSSYKVKLILILSITSVGLK